MKLNYLAFVGVILLFMAGCVSTPEQNNQTVPTTLASNSTSIVTASCNQNCFIEAANNCTSMNFTVTNDIGTFSYSSANCVLTKTLVKLNGNETQEMKNALEGKSMACIYEKGKFDQRWVTSLIYGIEYCQGELKDTLGELAVFSQ